MRAIILFGLSLVILIISLLWYKQSDFGDYEPLLVLVSSATSIVMYFFFSKEIYKEMKKTLEDYNIEYAFWALIVSTGVLVTIWISGFMKNHQSDAIGGVAIEFHGMVFDIVILSIGLGIYETLKQRKESEKKEQELKNQRIEKYKDEIDDFRHWKSDEAKFRIRGNLFRLNKEGETMVDLSFLDLSGIELRKIKLGNSNMCDTNFSNSNMENAEFDNILCTGAKYNGKKTFLYNANFRHAHIQHTEFIEAYLGSADFSEAKLSSVNFSKADLRGVIFQNAYLDDPSFEGAEVSSDFFEKLSLWDIDGYSISNNYRIIKIPVIGHAGHSQYFLKNIF